MCRQLSWQDLYIGDIVGAEEPGAGSALVTALAQHTSEALPTPDYVYPPLLF